MRWVRRLLIVAFVAGLVVGTHLFVDDNKQTVDLDLVAFRVEAVEVWLLLLGSFAAGVVLAGGIGLFRGARLRLLVRRYRKTARELSAEVHELRNLPLSGHPGDGGEAGAPDDGLERGG
ncbi:MAG: lipopolysaccharide assembly protein LapA domain-containing protein [Myxococcota bacterium]|nr:lipopolysaccharide assembly protein LapA domain-containing protein [Myxococcota bacterium]